MKILRSRREIDATSTESDKMRPTTNSDDSPSGS